MNSYDDPTSCHRFIRKASLPCPLPNGTRVEMTGLMRDDPDPVPECSTGTVVGGNGAQLFVDWDNGRRLLLLINRDPYRVLERPQRTTNDVTGVFPEGVPRHP